MNGLHCFIFRRNQEETQWNTRDCHTRNAKTHFTPLNACDAEPMYRNWASDPGVTKFLTWPTHSSVEVTKQILALWASHYEELNYYQWGIVVKDENALIGTITAVKRMMRLKRQRSATASAETGGARAIRAKRSAP